VWPFEKSRERLNAALAAADKLKDDNAKLRKRNAELKSELGRLHREAKPAAGPKTPVAKGVWLKIGQKRGVSVYGFGRFPVTLYKKQWRKLLAAKEAIAKFIDDHDDGLA
jgi:hypothetical protein